MNQKKKKKKIYNEYYNAQELYSPDLFFSQQSEIEYLESEILNQIERNNIIKEKLKKKDENKDFPNDHQIYMKNILENLENKIIQEKKIINDLEFEISQYNNN